MNLRFFLKPLMIFAALAGLSACAKKDSDFAAKYAKNSFGANVKNADLAGAMLANANLKEA
ncbi:MAG: hypothetical protein ACOYOK_14050, partial [Pseudobdellovibrionaceae bacterium]